MTAPANCHECETQGLPYDCAWCPKNEPPCGRFFRGEPAGSCFPVWTDCRKCKRAKPAYLFRREECPACEHLDIDDGQPRCKARVCPETLGDGE